MIGYAADEEMIVTDTDARQDTERVLVGVDGSPESQQAVEWALRHADRASSRLELVSVVPTPWTAGIDAGWWEQRDEIEADARHQAEAVLDAAFDATDLPPRPVDIRVVVAQPPAAVLIEASEAADLLVVGAHGGGGFHGMLLGSVSAACTHHARCPVVVVRRHAAG